MANKPGYFKGYWEENRETILKKRKMRYEEDPEYREKVLASSREYRKSQRSEPRVKTRRFQRPIRGKSADGTDVVVHSVGTLSLLLGRSIQAINHWQKRDLLPDTPYKDGRGFRFYSSSMMRAIQEEVGEKRRLYPVDPQMKDRIQAKWVKDGVPVEYDGGDIEEAIRLTKSP